MLKSTRLLLALVLLAPIAFAAQPQPRMPRLVAPPAAPALEPRDPVSEQVRFAPQTGSAANPSMPPSPVFECLRTNGTRSQQNWHQSDKDGRQRWNVSISGSGCSIDVRAEGTLTFSADAQALQAISPGGFLEAGERNGAETRRVEARPGQNGIDYSYTVNGQTQAFEPQGRAWLASFLAGLERQTGFAVEVRVPALLQRGGPGAVLDEVPLLGGDYVRARYLLKMFDSAKLDDAALRRALELVRVTMRSDYESARVLMRISRDYDLADETTRQAFLAGADKLGSDYEHARVLLELLHRPNLSKTLVASALRSSQNLKSDYERARVLTAVAEQKLLDDTNVGDYLAAADSIRSDYERARTYIAAIDRVKLSDAAVGRLLGSLGSMRSDYEKARVMTTISGRYKMEGALREAYLRAAEGIRSTYERNRVLAGIVRRGAV